MMGRTHALTGWCAGLAAAGLLGYDQLGEVLLIAATTAGYALLPDLDHPGARASRLLGPATGALSWLLRTASAALYRWTKGPRDEPGRGTHRHMTHTVAFALLLGALTAVGTAAGGPWAVAGVVIFGLLLAEAALGDLVLPIAGGAAAVWVAAVDEPLQLLDSVGGWLGIAVATGCVTHCVGDALTESGCPFLWPIPWRGETWAEIRPPALLRFRTGKRVEQLLIFPAFVALALWLTPGAPDAIATVLERTTQPH